MDTQVKTGEAYRNSPVGTLPVTDYVQVKDFHDFHVICSAKLSGSLIQVLVQFSSKYKLIFLAVTTKGFPLGEQKKKR